MNAATIITSLRIALSPIFFVLFTTGVHEAKASAATILLLWLLFAAIESSDFVDGSIARKTGQVTDLGKVLDPFADSVARLTYFLAYLVAGILPAWVFLLVLYRDLGVSFVRLLAMRRGIAMAAQVSGKIKAFVYAVAGGIGLALVGIESAAAAGASWAARPLGLVRGAAFGR
jgi:CDP-diacylglycerol--glycerol-3-phosphate 3-phosphatidyltransferase